MEHYGVVVLGRGLLRQHSQEVTQEVSGRPAGPLPGPRRIAKPRRPGCSVGALMSTCAAPCRQIVRDTWPHSRSHQLPKTFMADLADGATLSQNGRPHQLFTFVTL